MGKVHGSLARAGKVKSQTPKVEKQEKAKQPKGRAKKRLLYNRRCVFCSARAGVGVDDIWTQFRERHHAAWRKEENVSGLIRVRLRYLSCPPLHDETISCIVHAETTV